MRVVPMALIALAIYWAIFFAGQALGRPGVLSEVLISVPLPSGGRLEFTGGDLSIVATLLLLGLALVRSATGRLQAGAVTMGLCLLTVLASLGLLLFVLAAATPAAVLIVLAALVEATAAAFIGTIVARRDISLGADGFDFGEFRREPARVAPIMASTDRFARMRNRVAPSLYRKVELGPVPKRHVETPVIAESDSIASSVPDKIVQPPAPFSPLPEGLVELELAKPARTGFWVTGRHFSASGDSILVTNAHVIVGNVTWVEPDAAQSLGRGADAPDADRDVQSEAARPSTDTVDCSVFAPSAIGRGKSALLQVLFHLKADLIKAAKMAQAIDATTGRRGFSTLEIPVARGAEIEILIEAPGLILADHFGAVRWDGTPQRLVFPITVPTPTKDLVRGTVFASVNGIPVGEVEFTLTIVEPAQSIELPTVASGFVTASPEEPDDVPVGQSSRRYASAFISYARTDFEKVSLFAQGLEQSGTRLFLDVTTIEPGEDWASKLEEGIRTVEAFFLMWSDNAAQSKWVQEEARRAVERSEANGGKPPRIFPITLHRDVTRPPDFLQTYHFDSRWLAQREAQKTALFKNA